MSKVDAARNAAKHHHRLPQKCEMPGCTEFGDRHHENYDKPLEIHWLCKRHHNNYHAAKRQRQISIKEYIDEFVAVVKGT